ncbi:hypothetical protein LAZ40_09545 [Cereibacter sphaeroides]|uniref:hypothetical protein n=1 Tax=Cereibacter sphaeroides TaxID=1063 RepID=UPI001F445B5C|nr:hypothetical protein [Cereibacter sphaeroides]MCE6959295.1 hypothetical protein [Cereibacter sphaeroides]MCE6972887.1 hypothetical protein [Cereibacter sphaeroides]
MTHVFGIPEPEPLALRLAASRVRDTSGLLRVLHAAGPAPLLRFGSRSAARHWAEHREEAALHRAWLDIRAPLDLGILDSAASPAALADAIAARTGAWSTSELSRIAALPQEEARAVLAFGLRALGHDGLCGLDPVADPGERVWIALDPEQVITVEETTIGHDRAPWEIPATEFCAAHEVGDCFFFEGREEDFDWIWADAALPGRLLPQCWRGAEDRPAEAGYRIHELVSGPAGTLVLIDPDGVACGFRMGAILWIDEAHRGRGLSTPLIFAACDRMGGPIASANCCYSIEGHAAHVAAHRAALREAPCPVVPAEPAARKDADAEDGLNPNSE